jgi:hypothetical protein
VLALVPADQVPYRDLVWPVTLVPAYLLSLHYGMRGAPWQAWSWERCRSRRSGCSSP